MLPSEPRVVFDASKVYDIKERSDFDPHESKQNIVAQLESEGEDWGDGFIVQDEMVVVTRSKKDGRIIRTTPMSEALFMKEADEERYEPIEVDSRITPSPLGIGDREKIVDILAWRLFKYYREQPPHPTRYNPIHDGILDAPAGSPENLQPLPGSKLYPATPGEVFEWLKTKVIGPRAQIVNKAQGRTGVATDYALRISRKLD